MGSVPQWPLLQQDAEWYRRLYRHQPLYDWQLEVALALCQQVMLAHSSDPPEVPFRGLLNVSRQGGKDHVLSLWTLHQLLKWGQLCRLGQAPFPVASMGYFAPTWRPGIVVAQRRLRQAVDELPPTRGQLHFAAGYEARIGHLPSSCIYQSVNPQANQRGETTTLARICNEVQDVDKPTYDQRVAPMGATTAAPSVFSGTAGPLGSMIEVLRLELAAEEERCGDRRLFVYPWQVVARDNPNYDRHCRAERERLGPRSLIWLLEYECVGVDALDRFCSVEDLVALASGEHRRGRGPEPGKTYVYGVDYCGTEEEPTEALDPERARRRDSTCVVICEATWREVTPETEDEEASHVPILRVVDWLWLPGVHDVGERVYEFAHRHWRCRFGVHDANGVGDSPSRLVQVRAGEHRVKRLPMSAQDNSRLGYRFQAAIRSEHRRFVLPGAEGHRRPELPGYEAAGCPELTEALVQLEQLVREVSVGRTRAAQLDTARLMRWGHPPSAVWVDGSKRVVHDDFAKACALALEAAYEPDLWQRRGPLKPQRYVPWDEAAGYAGGAE